MKTVQFENKATGRIVNVPAGDERRIARLAESQRWRPWQPKARGRSRTPAPKPTQGGTAA